MPVSNMPEPAMTYVGPDREIGYYNATQVQALVDRINELEGDNANYCTVMMAAAVEITEHWDAHCDSEGYGPANLVRRLENCYPSQYGYDSQTVVRMEKRINEFEADAARLQKVCMVIGRHWRQLPAVVCDDFNEAMKKSL